MRWLRAERDRAAGVAFLVAGAACLVVGYAGVAGATYVPQALSFIASGGFFGLLLVAVGATLLITAALHDEWRKLDRIEKAIDRLAQSGSTVDLAEGDSGNGHGLRATGLQAEAPPARPARPVASVSPTGESAVLLAVDSRRLVAVAVGGLAAAGLVGGGWGATASAVTDTAAYSTLLLGIGGLAVAGLVSAGWTLSLRRSARVRQARLLRPFAAVVAQCAERDGGLHATGAARVAVAEGLTRFHTPGCAATSALAVRLVEEAEAVRSGLTRCRLCDPTA